MKIVYHTGNESNFICEVSILQHCSHPHIIQLVDIVIDEDKKVEAMLIEYVENANHLENGNHLLRRNAKSGRDK